MDTCPDAADVLFAAAVAALPHCPLCKDPLVGETTKLCCGHRYCTECIRDYVEGKCCETGDGHALDPVCVVVKGCVACPECGRIFSMVRELPSFESILGPVSSPFAPEERQLQRA